MAELPPVDNLFEFFRGFHVRILLLRGPAQVDGVPTLGAVEQTAATAQDHVHRKLCHLLEDIYEQPAVRHV